MPQTIRQQIIALLKSDWMQIRDLSQLIGCREKEIITHLPHIERTVKQQGGRLSVLPARCRSCGYVFNKRKHLGPPGRCPHCKSGYLEPPAYHIGAPPSKPT